MAFSPIPDTTLTLPATTFRITPSSSQNQDGLTPRPSLRVSLQCTLLVPGALFPGRVSVSKFEKIADAVIPVGGRVGLGMDVEEDGIVLVTTKERDVVKEKEDVGRTCWLQLSNALKQNKDLLALRSVTTTKTSCSQDEPIQAAQLSSSITPTNWILHPRAAEPNESPTHRHLIPSGKPIAYLTHIHLSFKWVPRITRVKTTDLEEVTSGSQSQSQRPSISACQGEDDDILMDEEDIVDDFDVSLLVGTNPVHENDEAVGEGQNGLPAWAQAQVDTAMHKVMRIYMIKRFPLIFDSGLLAYSRSLFLPPSLASSISNILATSSRHKTPLAQKATHVLKLIFDSRETYIKQKVQQAFDLRPVKTTKKAPLTKILESSQAGSRTVEKRRSRITSEEASDAVEDYMNRLREQVCASDWADPRRGQERTLKRVLSETLGTIGRAKWDGARRGRKRLAYFRIRFESGNEDLADEEDESSIKDSSALQCSYKPSDFHGEMNMDDTMSIIDDDGDFVYGPDEAEGLSQQGWKRETRTMLNGEHPPSSGYDDVLLDDEDEVDLDDGGEHGSIRESPENGSCQNIACHDDTLEAELEAGNDRLSSSSSSQHSSQRFWNASRSRPVGIDKSHGEAPSTSMFGSTLYCSIADQPGCSDLDQDMDFELEMSQIQETEVRKDSPYRDTVP